MDSKLSKTSSLNAKGGKILCFSTILFSIFENTKKTSGTTTTTNQVFNNIFFVCLFVYLFLVWTWSKLQSQLLLTWALGDNPQTMAPAQAQHQANYYRSIFLIQPRARSASKDLEYRSNSANPGSQSTLTLISYSLSLQVSTHKIRFLAHPNTELEPVNSNNMSTQVLNAAQ